MRVPQLRLPYGGGGPRQLAAFAEAPDPDALPGAEHFGTVARTRVPLPPGRWRLRTLSDDGVRVRVSTRDEPVIENWSWHGPTWDEGVFTVPENEPDVEIFVEHFELDGHAVLELRLEPVEDGREAGG